LATGATTGGGVRIGPLSLIGVGACIAPQMTVAAQALVGAGAVVVKHVAAHTTVVGNPARLIKAKVRQGWA
jgi:acetyltransferase-like isoleucine patch superfamily enzyme